MINTGSGSYFLNNGVTAPQGLQMYAEDMISAAAAAAAATATVSSGSHTGDFLYNISLLKDKINQVQSLASFFISPHDQNLQQQPSYNYGSTAIAIASIGTLIQEIIVTATSVMYTCQQMASVHNNNLSDGRLNTSSSGLWVNKDLINPDGVIERDPSGFYMSESLDWCGTTDVNKTTTCNTTTDVASRSNDISPRVCSSSNNIVTNVIRDLPLKVEKNPEESVQEKMSSLVKNYDIVELKAADILAKYTHYCQVCGKGFKRDANLRMHMRAHGDEYKSSAALSNPLKNNNGGEGQQGKAHDHGVVPAEVPRKYSCPHEGCRWNKKHAKFQPLKSMICVKNHYKRSHCPKMYVCKRCNKKQFSVLSDLRTHENTVGISNGSVLVEPLFLGKISLWDMLLCLLDIPRPSAP